MNAATCPIKTIQEEPMGRLQWLVVAICISILAMDGYDVLSIAFAAPGLTAEWGLSKAVLGIILPLELVGMALGSIMMGALADKRGRRPTMLAGLLIVTIGMACAGFAGSVYILGACRVFTGIGIGGLLATATATASDYCNNKYRSVALVLVAGGFALGIYAGATFLAPLLKMFDWRVSFFLGSGLSAALVPLVYFFVPESISYLNRKRPPGALEKIQSIMSRLGHPVPGQLSPLTSERAEPEGTASLFKAELRPITSILIAAYFGMIATYYFFVKWLPTIVSDLGYGASEAATVLGVISLGGVVGSIGMSIVSRYVAIRQLMIGSLILAAIGVAAFPYCTASLLSMKISGFLAGTFIFAGISGFFGLFAASFPSSVLGSGSGLVLGIGRGGAVLGPFIPGLLFSAGLDLKAIALLMSLGALVGGVLLIWLRGRSTDSPDRQVAAALSH
jgi:benzoate transport